MRVQSPTTKAIVILSVLTMKTFWRKHSIRGLFEKKTSREARTSTKTGVIRRHTEITITEETIVPDASKTWDTSTQNECYNSDPLAHEKPDKTSPYQVEISGGPASADDISDSGDSLTLVDSRSLTALTTSSSTTSPQRDPSCWTVLTSIFRDRKARESGIALEHISNGTDTQGD